MFNRRFFTGLIFFVNILTYSLWLKAFWPGLYIYDTFSLLKSIQQGHLGDWQSYIYELFGTFFYFISSDFSAMGVFQICFVSGFLAFVYYYFFNEGSLNKLTLIILCLFPLFPLNGGFTIFYSRDVIFAWVNMAATIYLFNLLLKHKNKISISNVQLLTLSGLLTLTSLLRQDAIILPMLFPLLTWKLGLCLRQKKFWKINAIHIAILLFFFIAVPRLLSVSSSSRSYKISALVNPLSYIINKHGFENTVLPREQKILTQGIQLPMIQKYYDPLEIPAFHKGMVNQQQISKMTNSEWNKFLWTHLQIFWRHRDLFIDNRLNMFTHLLAKPTVYFTDDLGHPSTSNEFIEIKEKIKPAPRDGVMATFLRKISFYQFHTNNPIGVLHTLFFSNLLPFLFLMISLISWKSAPKTAWCSLLIASRIPLVFFFAPAAQFKYLYSVYIYFFIFLPIFLWEVLKGKLRHS